jgi:HK97 family phage portal protein
VKSGLRRLRNQTPVPYAPPGRSLPGGLLSGFAPSSETYLGAQASNGTLWQIVNLLSGSCARAEWRLYRKNTDNRRRYSTGDSGSDQRTEVLQHQALNVLQRPGMMSLGVPAFTRMSLFELSWVYLELAGESPWVVQRDPRATFPMGLWPVRPDRLQPVPDPDTFLKGWVYTGPSGEKVPLGVDELIMEKYPNPLDPYRGLGPVQAILVDLDAARYSARWNLSFFLNSAQPGGIIEVDHTVEDDEWDDLQERWRESHQGVSRAHRVAVLEGGQKWVPNSMTLRDMDFANLRGVSREIIREAWGIHKSMMGLSDDVNRANAQTAAEVFHAWKIVSRLDRRRDTLNSFFLPLFGSTGQGVEFDYVAEEPANREEDNAELTAKANAAAVLITQAGLDPHDVLEVVGLPDMAMAAVAPAAPAPPPDIPPPDIPPASEDGMHARLARMLGNGHMPVGSLR